MCSTSHDFPVSLTTVVLPHVGKIVTDPPTRVTSGDNTKDQMIRIIAQSVLLQARIQTVTKHKYSSIQKAWLNFLKLLLSNQANVLTSSL